MEYTADVSRLVKPPPHVAISQPHRNIVGFISLQPKITSVPQEAGHTVGAVEAQKCSYVVKPPPHVRGSSDFIKGRHVYIAS